MRVYHGTTTYKGLGLAEGKARRFGGLSVTDTAERAQLYADAQASGMVSTELRYCKSSLVVELEVAPVEFRCRPDSHHTLDKVEAEVAEWDVVSATARMTSYDVEHSVTRGGVKVADALKAAFGDRLVLIIEE